MPLGCVYTGAHYRAPVVDTSDCVVPVCEVTQVVVKDGKKFKKVSTVYESSVPSSNSVTEEASSQAQFRPCRVVHRYEEIRE